jgi:hypothetical protein
VSICVKCQGRKLLCGLPRCPIRDRISVFRLALSKASGAEVFGSSPPAAVVGSAAGHRLLFISASRPTCSARKPGATTTRGFLWGLPLEEIARLRSYVTFGVRRAKTPWELGNCPTSRFRRDLWMWR